MAEMRLLERLLVNNPVYAWLQRREVASLYRLAAAQGLHMLDLGCGRGVELKLIAEAFRPRVLVAFDLDPQQLRLARTHLSHNGRGDVQLLQANAARLPFGDRQFEAAVEMAVLHHVPDWRNALREVARVLKPGGLFYLHCDPTAGPYLRVLMDAVFGPKQFLNEITWQRTGAHSDAKRWGRVADTLLMYAKGENWTWNTQYEEYSEEYVKERYKYVDDATGRLHWRNTMTAAGPGPPRRFRGVLKEPPAGTHWRFSQEQIDRMEQEGRIYYSPRGMPYVKSYLDERLGRPIQSVWTDIVMSKSGKERLHYATQKPLALLERIVSASSNRGDVVLDPFCGCGTAIHAAHKLGRRWIGIDITYLAINLIERRMTDAFPGIAIETIGDPKDLAGARDLAQRDKWQFQWWALTRLDAQPVAGKKKGADKGIDGVIPFFAGPKDDYKRAIVSVKGGEHVGVAAVRDLVGVLEREKEPIGILLTLAPPTKDMVTEAAAAGFYESDFWKRKFPRVQIITVEEMLAGKRPDIPWGKTPFARAPREKETAEQEALL